LRVGLYINSRKKKLPDVLDIIFQLFSLDNDEVVFLNAFDYINSKYDLKYDSKNISKDSGYDVLLAIGGDGTTMSAIRSQFHHNKPILGIHVGNLGFLAESDLDSCRNVLKQLQKKQFDTQHRSVFNVTVDGQSYISINDVVIDRGESGRIIRLNVFDRGKNVNSYEGDGLIISTANGSTGYSLSAGGPIISPDLHLFTLTPICSHSLMTRTIVLSQNSNLSIQFPEGQDKGKLTIDGQTTLQISENIKIDIKIPSKKVPFIMLDDSDYYNKLKTKMGWYNSRND
jgi:NAD+ kinase